MSTTAFSGPLVVYGQRPVVNGMPIDYNQNAGPSFFYDGAGLLDPRFGYFDAANLGYRAIGFYGSSGIPILDVVPSTLAANNIAAAQTVTAGTPMTLVSATGAGITVLSAIQQVLPSGNKVPSGSLAIDGIPSILQFGSSRDIGIYDPSKALSRAVRVVTNADDSGGFYTINGYDIYGYQMSYKLTGASTGTTTTTKAFKFITSIVPSGTINSTSVTVGTTDVLGLPIRADFFGDLRINWPDTLITATTGFVAAVTTSPATQVTGDVRGTYTLQTASDGTRHLQVFATPRPTNLATSAITGLFGVTQV